MKLKQIPQDFIVEEIPNFLPSKEKQSHTIFIMEKKSITTYDAIHSISKKCKIPINEIGYAGLKDKHAITKQYISIPSQYLINSENTDKIHLKFVGYNNKKIQIGNLNSNRFNIVVRDIARKELKYISMRARFVGQYGVPNYFDSQRFGSVSDHEFIVKHMLMKNYEKAVKIYLTSSHPSDSRSFKNDKIEIINHWDDLSDLKLHNNELKKVIREYNKTNNWSAAYNTIPAKLRHMYLNAYQSYLWNECIKELLKQYVNNANLFSIKYAVDSLLFFLELTKKEFLDIPTTFKTITHNDTYSVLEHEIIGKVLLKQGIMLHNFKSTNLKKHIFKSYNRQTLIKPRNFHISEPKPDIINSSYKSDRYAIELSFILTSGSYATIIIKQLFNS